AALGGAEGVAHRVLAARADGTEIRIAERRGGLVELSADEVVVARKIPEIGVRIPRRVGSLVRGRARARAGRATARAAASGPSAATCEPSAATCEPSTRDTALPAGSRRASAARSAASTRFGACYRAFRWFRGAAAARDEPGNDERARHPARGVRTDHGTST